MQTNNKLREAVELAKSTFETLIQFQGDEGFVKTWAGLGRDAMIAALATSATTEKSSAVGDAAKLREALKAISGLCTGLMPTWDGAIGRIKDITEAALAAPPRNCDLPEVAKDPWRAWLDDKSNWDEDGNPELEIHDWLFAPAAEKEGGAK